jgi:Tfp pilus assembly protein PilV
VTSPGRQDGFSLAEVVVALGLLASVLISVAGLLVLGNRQVAGGRSSSEALAVGRDVLEEMKAWPFAEVTAAFASDCTLDAVASCVVQSGSSAAMFAWDERAKAMLFGARIELVLDSLDGAMLDVARGIRITVTVHWVEGTRARSARLAAVRM